MLVKAWQIDYDPSHRPSSWNFYPEGLGFKHEGKLDRFEIIRVHDGFTIDLVQSNPKDRIHYAILHR